MRIHYLEIVTKDIDAVCKTYEEVHGIVFGEPDELLGGAKTCLLPDGSIVGVRGPLRDTEESVIRPYWLVSNIGKSVDILRDHGTEIALPPTEIPGKGTFSIYIQGQTEQGSWQL